MTVSASTIAAQGRTLVQATNHREPWAQVEVDLVIETREIPAEEVAETLGRTLYAIQWARHALDAGLPLGGGHGPSEAPSSPRQRAYTFIDGDYPPGWMD